MSCWSEPMLAHAGKQILEGCPPGQQEAARKMLQEQSVPVITEALVTRVGLTEDQPASTSQPSRKTVTLKTPKTDSQVYIPSLLPTNLKRRRIVLMAAT